MGVPGHGCRDSWVCVSAPSTIRRDDRFTPRLGSRARAQTTMQPAPSAVQGSACQTIAYCSHLAPTTIPPPSAAPRAVRAPAFVCFRPQSPQLAIGHAEELQHVENVQVLGLNSRPRPHDARAVLGVELMGNHSAATIRARVQRGLKPSQALSPVLGARQGLWGRVLLDCSLCRAHQHTQDAPEPLVLIG